MRVLGGEAVGVFVHIERANQHGAGGGEALDKGRVAAGRRMVAIDLRARQGHQPCDIEEVLHRVRDAGERSRIVTGGQRTIDRIGLA